MSTRSDAVRRAFEQQLIDARASGQAPPSVASIAAAVGIARSSMYRFHPEVVARIQALAGGRRDEKHEQLRLKSRLLSEQLNAEKALTRALARVVAELAAESEAMRNEFEDATAHLELRIERLQKIHARKGARVARSS
jgi:AcrR family transcriptional regulator